MIHHHFLPFISAVAIMAVSAQTCQQDVLVDDFRPRDSTMFRTQPPGQGCETNTGFNGCNKTLNLLGGDYGDSGCTEGIANGQLSILAGNNTAISALEAESHPNTAITFNYWFVKFNWENDFDLTPFTAMRIDLIAPPGSDFNITLTQWIPATQGLRDGTGTRGIDSVYHLLSSYITPNGQPQSLIMPLSGFTTNLNGGAYDLANLKDLTLVNLGPVGTNFIFTKIVLVGNCSTSSTSSGSSGMTSTTGTPGASSKLASTSQTSASVSASSSSKSNSANRNAAGWEGSWMGLVSAFIGTALIAALGAF